MPIILLFRLIEEYARCKSKTFGMESFLLLVLDLDIFSIQPRKF